ncbi:MAG: MFS transporter [Anaerolineales bacterium]
MASRWRKNLRAVWWAELLAVVGFAAFIPILAYYVEFLGVEESAVASWTGIVSAATAFAMGIMGPIWGTLSDRYGRKVMVERAMFSGSVVILLMGFAGNVQQLTLLRLVQGGLTGTVTATRVLVASSAPRDQLGRALGRLQMAIFLGQTLGPVAGGLIADYLGYRTVFWVTAAFLVMAGFIILWGVKEEFSPPPEEERRPFWPSLRENFSVVLASSVLALVLGLRFLLRVGIRFTIPVQPLLVEQILDGSPLLGSASGLLMTVSGISGAIAAPLFGNLIDRHGERPILFICGVVAGAALVLQGLTTSYPWLVIWQFFMGIAIGGTLAGISTYVGRLAPEGRAGMAYGLDTMAVSMSSAVGPFVGGWLGSFFNLRVPFVAGGVVMALGSLAVLRLPKGDTPALSRQGEPRQGKSG